MLKISRVAQLAVVLCSFMSVTHVNSAEPSAKNLPAGMERYTVTIRDTDISFDMVPIPGGEFVMGSPDSEEGRNDDEGPQHKVKIEPFWMGKYEVSWDELDAWQFCRDKQIRDINGRASDETDRRADAMTRPTLEYQPVNTGRADKQMGRQGFPACSMTNFAAQMYCEWLSKRTGHYYRLPTEAEWEYACRAGTTTAFSWGDDPDKIDDYAWYYENADEEYHKSGQKKPNPWGLYDMHGNLSEWVLDGYDEKFYSKFKGDHAVEFPINISHEAYNIVLRGGSFDDDPEDCRSATRMASDEDLKIQDPQLPKSMWWLTDGQHVGFRVIRPLTPPTEDEVKKYGLRPVPPQELFKEEKLSKSCE